MKFKKIIKARIERARRSSRMILRFLNLLRIYQIKLLKIRLKAFLRKAFLTNYLMMILIWMITISLICLSNLAKKLTKNKTQIICLASSRRKKKSSSISLCIVIQEKNQARGMTRCQGEIITLTKRASSRPQ